MKSMTGFGFAESTEGRFAASVELKSYNNRYLDLSLNLPPSLSALEERIRETLRARVARGRLECHVRFRDLQEDLSLSLDEANVAAYAGLLEKLRGLAGIAEPVGLQHLLAMEGLVRVDRRRETDLYWRSLEGLLAQALDGLEQSRSREGAAILVDLKHQLDRIRRGVAGIEGLVPRIEEQIRVGLRQRFREVLGDLADEQRMLAEVAVQLVRYSINEELVRLHAHLEAALALMEGSEASGKRLDFLCQEMNREVNTIGSKNVVVDISAAVIDIKDALENIREQIRNVE